MARKIQPKSNFPRQGQSSEEYWRDRETRQRAQNIKDEAKTAEKINRIFQTVQDDLQSEIDAFYANYANKEGITLTEARGRVTRADIEKYQRLADKYVKAARRGDKKTAFSKQADAQMKLYNLTMKVNRLEMLKARCGVRTMEGYSELEKLINENLEMRTYSEYERLASILGNSVQMNENLARSIVNASYQTATWSDRLWANQSELSNKIGSALIAGVIAGRNSRDLARQIQKATGQSTFNCQRLMRTEMRRVQTAAAEQSMRDNGVRQYMYMVANGINPCDECLALDGKVFDLDKMMVGENAPPKHPLCHCCSSPYVNEEKWQQWLDGPAQNGVPWNEFEAGTQAQAPTKAKEETNDFKPAKTKAEAQEYAKKFANSVDYTGMTLENANKVNEALEKLTSKYPIKKLDTITKRARGGAIMSANHSTLNINGRKLSGLANGLNDYKARRASLEEQVSLIKERWAGKAKMSFGVQSQIDKIERKLMFNRFAVNQTCDNKIYAVVAHEYGHILSDQYFGMINDSRANPNYSTNWKLRGMNDKWVTAFKTARESGDIYKLSEYASTDYQEFFAECFCAKEMGETLPDYVDELMSEVLKNGIM